MRTHRAPSLSRLKDFSDQMDVAPDEPECPRGERSKRIREPYCPDYNSWVSLCSAWRQPASVSSGMGV